MSENEDWFGAIVRELVLRMRTHARNRWRYRRMMLDADDRSRRVLFCQCSEVERQRAVQVLERLRVWRHLMQGAQTFDRIKF